MRKKHRICSHDLLLLAPMNNHDKSLKLIKTLSEAHGPSGFEAPVRSIVADLLHPYGSLDTDRCGSLLCTQKSSLTQEHKQAEDNQTEQTSKPIPKVMIATHMDEIGFLVQHITADGFLTCVPLGGWWEHTLLSQRVLIRTDKGTTHPGLIGSKPPHFLPEAQRRQVLPLDAMFIDVGASSRDEVENELGIHLGSPIVPDTPFTTFPQNTKIMGKAFDNRLGLAAMIETMRDLSGTPLPHHLIGAATVQEELGMRGAKTAGAHTLPDCALILEAPPADDTPGFSPSESQGSLGKGVQIRLFDPTAVMNPKLAEFILNLAREHNIPHQVAVRRTGGTDAGALHLIKSGIPCIVLGVPTRYIHAHNGIADLRDYEALLSLLRILLPRLDSKTVSSFTQYL